MKTKLFATALTLVTLTSVTSAFAADGGWHLFRRHDSYSAPVYKPEPRYQPATDYRPARTYKPVDDYKPAPRPRPQYGY
jgi:hypothetical protein